MNAYRIAAASPGRNGIAALTGTDGASALEALAAAISRDPRFSHLTLVVRRSLHPELWAFGETDSTDVARLRHLSRQIYRADRNARYIDYPEAERLAAILAAKLTKRYSRAALRDFEFRPIPTGGLIVIGMLAYALGLPAKNLTRTEDPDRPVVFVDDCVLSGMRFSEYRAAVADRPVILAALCAPAAIAAQAAATGAFDCIAAVELQDLAPELYGSEYAAWHTSWQKRVGDSVLWVGQPEYLCFAWNEPESAFHNTVTDEMERGFRLVGPERCMRARHVEAHAGRPVQVLRDGPGPYRPAANVAWARVAGDRIAAAISEERADDSACECYLLDGSAADMWNLLIEHGEIQNASRAFAELYDADPDVIDADMTRFAGSLVETGLLVRG